jgi:hypothetical protein
MYIESGQSGDLGKRETRQGDAPALVPAQRNVGQAVEAQGEADENHQEETGA